MFETYLASSELVLFWGKDRIDKTMMFSDFQATLDGMVGISGYERQERRAAYLQLDDGLKVRSCVLFTIGFDASGFPERSWNLPLKHMAEIAGRGPDMGGGPINLVCRSQCSISWHAPKLWDPVMQPGGNTFEQIAGEVAEAAPRLGLKPSRRSSAIAPAFPATADAEADIPVLTESEPVPGAAAPDPGWAREREQIMSRLAEQQLQISTLTTDKNETVARMGLVHQQQLDILEAQNNKLLGQHKAMREQADALRSEVDVLRQQISSLRGSSRTWKRSGACTRSSSLRQCRPGPATRARNTRSCSSRRNSNTRPAKPGSGPNSNWRWSSAWARKPPASAARWIPCATISTSAKKP